MQDDLDAWLAGDDEPEARRPSAFEAPPGRAGLAPDPFAAGGGEAPGGAVDPFAARRPPSGRRPAAWDDGPRRPRWQRAALLAVPCLALAVVVLSRGSAPPTSAAQGADASEVPAPAAGEVAGTEATAGAVDGPTSAVEGPAAAVDAPAASVDGPAAAATMTPVATTPATASVDPAAPGGALPVVDPAASGREALVGAAAVTAVRTGVPVDAGAGRQRYVDLATVEAIAWRGDLAVVRVLAVVLEGADGQVTDTTLRRYAVAARDAGSTAELLGGPWPLSGPVAIVGQPGLQYEPPQDPGPVVAALEAAGWSQVTVSSTGRDPALPGIVAAVVEAVAPGETAVATHTPWLAEEGGTLTVLGV